MMAMWRNLAAAQDAPMRPAPASTFLAAKEEAVALTVVRRVTFLPPGVRHGKRMPVLLCM